MERAGCVSNQLHPHAACRCQKEVAAGDEGAFFALGQTWHTPCFACTKCRKGLTGEEVFDNKVCMAHGTAASSLNLP
jgi:hypothetical protein